MKKSETHPVKVKVAGEFEPYFIALVCSDSPEDYSKWTLRLLVSKTVDPDTLTIHNRWIIKIMIPKIIHYTWFSGDPYPEKIQQCMKSWQKYAPDYEFRLWDMAAIKDIDSIFMREALSVRKWAYAADYVRLYALYHFGGVYLDTDVMLCRSLNDFLGDGAFIGKETFIHFLEHKGFQGLSSHCMGGEAGHPFFKDCLKYFDGRHFIQTPNEEVPIVLRYNMVLLPYIQAEIAREYGYDWRPLTQEIQRFENGLVIYPSEYFEPDPNPLTPRSVCRHLTFGSWRENKNIGKPREYNYTIVYKIRWRFLNLLCKILHHYNYFTVVLD